MLSDTLMLFRLAKDKLQNVLVQCDPQLVHDPNLKPLTSQTEAFLVTGGSAVSLTDLKMSPPHFSSVAIARALDEWTAIFIAPDASHVAC